MAQTFIVEVESPAVRALLKQHGKTGTPTALNTIIIFETSMSAKFIRQLPGVISVEEETTDSPFSLAVQARPLSWFLPSASNTMPDYHYNRTGKGVAIYVMDSGIRLDHKEFEGRDIETIFSYDGFDYGGDVDGPDHGTMAASCAAGNEHGIAKEATIYNLRYNWSSIAGIKALDTMLAHHRSHNMPSILSMSFGSRSNIYDSIFTQLAEEGVVLVAAAGNYDEPFATFPAARSDVIAVAACDSKLEPSVWGSSSTPGTSYGPQVDIWAGGTGGVAASIYTDTATQWAGGTSSACPLVAGALALQLEGSAKLNSYNEVLETKAALLENSRKDVIKYTDSKYQNTANRYIYTLLEGEAPEPAPTPTPTPTPTPDKDEKSSKLPLILGVGVVLVLAAIFLL